jgi:hypothetical protein
VQLDSTDLEHVHHVGVSAEEDVQAGLIPVTVLVLPCSNLSRQQRVQRAKPGSTYLGTGHIIPQSGTRPDVLQIDWWRALRAGQLAAQEEGMLCESS